MPCPQLCCGAQDKLSRPNIYLACGVGVVLLHGPEKAIMNEGGKMINKKNIFVIGLIVVLLAVTLLIGCGSDQEINTGDNETVTQEQMQSDIKKNSMEETEATDIANKEVAAKDTEETTEVSYDKETTTTSTKASEKEPSKTATAATKEPSSQPTKPTIEVTKATEAAKVCYITVDGYCSSKEIGLKGGETVYDILKATGVSVSARSTGYGIYIEGINGRYEFDEGPTSGWIYTVNGTRPSTSCNKYEVKDGDKIVWTYVTEM